MAIGAFFDVDGTLYNANMWRGLVKYASDHGSKLRVRLYLVRNMPLFYLRRLKLIDEETFRKPWVLTLGSLVHGWDASRGDAAFRWVAEGYIRPTANDRVIDRLQQHVAQGHVVILVSAMLAPTLKILGDALGVSGTVGTQIEFAGGRYTGRVIPPVCTGIEKDRMTRRFLQSHNIEIDFPSSYAYADSISDLALFEMVGHPVAVYPDQRLAALARERDWQMITGDKNDH